MIADHAGHIHAAQFAENIRSGAPGDNDTWVQRRQATEQISSSDAHASLVRMLNNGRQRSIEIKRAQSPLLGQPYHNRAGSQGKKVLHR
jgi:hypothetical protein